MNSKIEIRREEDPRGYKISGHISDMDFSLDPVKILRDVRDHITQTLIDEMMVKLRERLESELNKALDTMFQEKRG